MERGPILLSSFAVFRIERAHCARLVNRMAGLEILPTPARRRRRRRRPSPNLIHH